MEKQPVAWEDCCVEYWCEKTRKHMSWWTGHRDITETSLKMALNPNHILYKHVLSRLNGLVRRTGSWTKPLTSEWILRFLFWHNLVKQALYIKTTHIFKWLGVLFWLIIRGKRKRWRYLTLNLPEFSSQLTDEKFLKVVVRFSIVTSEIARNCVVPVPVQLFLCFHLLFNQIVLLNDNFQRVTVVQR